MLYPFDILGAHLEKLKATSFCRKLALYCCKINNSPPETHLFIFFSFVFQLNEKEKIFFFCYLLIEFFFLNHLSMKYFFASLHIWFVILLIFFLLQHNYFINECLFCTRRLTGMYMTPKFN